MNFLIRQRQFLTRSLFQIGSLKFYRPSKITIKQCSAQISSVSSILSKKDFQNELSANSNVFEVFNIIPGDKNKMELQDVMRALNQIFQLQKDSKINSSKVIANKNFDLLCRKLIAKGVEMDINETIQCLKIFNYLGVRSDSRVVNFCLSIVQKEVNDLTLDQMIFLNFLFKKMTKTPRIEALQIAIPMVFQIQMGMKLDHENVKQLVDLLQFVADVKTTPQCVNSIVSALTINGCENITPQQAISIIWSLTDLHQFSKFYEKLYNNCLHIIKNQIMEISFNSLETTITKIAEKIYLGQNNFYDEEFFDKCVDYTITRNEGFHNSIYILKKFNRIAFVSYKLLDYIDSLVLEDPNLLKNSRMSVLLNFLHGFSIANHKSKNWEIIKLIILEHPMIHGSNFELPWMKFALEMVSLDIYDQILLRKIFSLENFEKLRLNEKKFADHLQLYDLYQSITYLKNYDIEIPENSILRQVSEYKLNSLRNSSIQEMYGRILADIFDGEDFVLRNLLVEDGKDLYLDFAIVFDKDKRPVRISQKTVTEIKSLGLTTIAVFFLSKTKFVLNYPEKLRGVSSLKFRVLDQCQIPHVYFNLNFLKKMDEMEKLNYISSKIQIELRNCS